MVTIHTVPIYVYSCLQVDNVEYIVSFVLLMSWNSIIQIYCTYILTARCPSCYLVERLFG